MQRFSGPMPNPLMEKINETHINRILDLSETEETNSYKDAQSTKKYKLIYTLVGVALFIFITVYLAKENKDLFMEIIKIIGFVVGGFGGGYGYKTYLDSKKKK